MDNKQGISGKGEISERAERKRVGQLAVKKVEFRVSKFHCSSVMKRHGE